MLNLKFLGSTNDSAAAEEKPCSAQCDELTGEDFLSYRLDWTLPTDKQPMPEKVNAHFLAMCFDNAWKSYVLEVMRYDAETDAFVTRYTLTEATVFEAPAAWCLMNEPQEPGPIPWRAVTKLEELRAAQTNLLFSVCGECFIGDTIDAEHVCWTLEVEPDCGKLFWAPPPAACNLGDDKPLSPRYFSDELTVWSLADYEARRWFAETFGTAFGKALTQACCSAEEDSKDEIEVAWDGSRLRLPRQAVVRRYPLSTIWWNSWPSQVPGDNAPLRVEYTLDGELHRACMRFVDGHFETEDGDIVRESRRLRIRRFCAW